jgi:hypothetical protein
MDAGRSELPGCLPPVLLPFQKAHPDSWAQIMSADKMIRRVTDPERQQAEAYRYWQSLPVGDRLSAVGDASEAAYGFAAAFRGVPVNDAQGSERTITRLQRSRR